MTGNGDGDGDGAADLVLVDDPGPGVRRITLNRPEKRNALNNPLRGALLSPPCGPPTPTPTCGSSSCGARARASRPATTWAAATRAPSCRSTPPGEGQWPRHVTEGWMSIWDLAKPVIAQVHGYCLAGGSELATGCDLVYVAEDAKIGYPAVRFGVPDMQFHAWFMGMRTAMEMMLTGDSISGDRGRPPGLGQPGVPRRALDDEVLAVAARIAKVPPDIAQLNKRTVHRAMDVMGLRAAIRAGTELCALAIHQPGFQAFIDAAAEKGLVAALTERDEPFGDYRTSPEPH